MRKLFCVIMLVGFLAPALDPQPLVGARKPEPASQTAGEPGEGPRAFLPETSWDFGKIPTNSVVSHSFWIKNVGTDTLKILSVRPG